MEIPPEPRGPFLRECSQTSLFPLSRRPDSLLARVWLRRRGLPPSPLKMCGFGTPFLAGSSFPNFPHWRWQTDVQGGGSGTGSTFRDACQPSQHPGLHLPSRAPCPGGRSRGQGREGPVTRRGSGGGTRLPPQQQEGLLGLRAERAPAAGRQRRSRLRDPPALRPSPASPHPRQPRAAFVGEGENTTRPPLQGAVRAPQPPARAGPPAEGAEASPQRVNAGLQGAPGWSPVCASERHQPIPGTAARTRCSVL